MSSDFEFDRDVDQQIADLDHHNRAVRRRNLIMVLLAIIALLFGLVSGWLAYDNHRLATDNARYGAEQAQEKKTIAKEAQTALCGTKDSEIYDKAICEKLAEVAEEPAPPVAAPPVPGGPSQAELVEAFRKYCEDGNCKGKDGAPPTADDIAAAFVKFCSTRDGCRGPAGEDAPPAKDGRDGADGKPGADGKTVGPTQEMVLAVLTSYCSTRDECRGPAGAAGADGPPPTEEAIVAAVQKVCASSDLCRGPAGPTGATGATGEKGEKGDPPSQFTFTDRLGTTHTCTPNPPGSTTYTCDPQGPGPAVMGVNP